MQNSFLRYSLVFLLLLVYINRGLFVTPYEVKYQGEGEVNTLFELIQQLVTDKCNDIDEDGDSHSNFSSTSIFILNSPQQPIQVAFFSKDTQQKRFPLKENFIFNNFCSRLEQPPKV